MRFWRRVWVRRLFALLAAGTVLGVWPTDDMILVPGVTRDLGQIIVEPPPRPGAGRLFMVTVGVQPASQLLAIYGKLNPNADLLPREQVLGPHRDEKRYRRETAEMMRQSQRTAEVAALRALQRLGVQVDPAAVHARIALDAEEITGPSAGLMFGLELVHRLGPEDLKRGRIIAGTGTIDPDGNVGPIGGMRQKVRAAERVGADLFLVPVRDYDLARRTARHVRVVPVRTLDEAIQVLLAR